MQLELENILVNLFTEYMQLPANYGIDKDGNEIPVIIIYGQNIKLHNTPKMQITVNVLNTQAYSNNSEFKNAGDDVNPSYVSNDTQLEQAIVQVDVYSANNEARKRYKEVQTCLTSLLAEQYQDKYQFKISQISDVTNTTGLDGAAYLNRYSIRFNCLTWFNNQVPINYYEKFPYTVQSEKGLIFEQK